MRAVQLQPVEAGLHRQPGRADEVVAHAVHVLARHGARPLAHAVQVLLRRGRDQRPVALGQRQVDPLPRHPRRALGTRMAELDAELGVAVGVYERDDARPAVALPGVPQAGAARRDARIGRHAGHLRHHQPGAAHGARAQVHEVVVGGQAVPARVLRHRRDHHAVLEREAAHGERREHRRHRGVVGQARRTGLSGDPVLERFEIGAVALAQVLVADALAAGEQRIGELLGRQVGVARDVLEPLGRVARGVLDAQHFDAARRFVVFERRHQVAGLRADAAREFDRVFQRQLGTRSDREMRCVRGIAHQHDGRAAVDVHPAPAHHARKTDPLRRAAQVGRVRHQLVAVQVLGEQALAEGDGVFLLHRLQAGLAPHLFGRLDDEGGRVGVEAVGVRLEPAMLGLLEGEGERVEPLVRAEPDKAAAARVDVRLVGGAVLGADAAVQAVAGDDEVGVGIRAVVLHVSLEDEPHALFLATRLQDVQEPLAADAAEAVAARAHHLAADVDFDVIPVVERFEDLRGTLGVGALQVAQRLVGEDHAPAEGVVRPVALDHRDVVRRVLPLHQQGEIQAGRAAADTDDLHEGSAIDAQLH